MGFDINIHDQLACESQGVIPDRTKEHLGSTDKGIVLYRRLLVDAIKRNEAGEFVCRRNGRWTARHRWNRPDRPDRRVLEGIRRNAPQALGLGRMKFPEGIKAVRFSFADQHGVLRGKTLSASAAGAALERGVTVTSTLLLKDTAHKTVFPAFTPGGGVGMAEMQGAADILMMPDPSTFRVLPWAPDTGWFLCDLQFPDGRPVPFCTRGQLRKALDRLESVGYEFVAGLEVEFHVFKITDPRLRPEDAGPAGHPARGRAAHHRLPAAHRAQVRPARRRDPLLRDGLAALELPLRSFELEFGPSQLEFTLAPRVGMAAADAMVLLRSAVKQIARRHGYHATFMCRPKLPNVMSSGWHLHQSLHAKRPQRVHLRQGGPLRRRASTTSPGCSPTRAARPRSPRRPSTATSVTARTRSRPTA